MTMIKYSKQQITGRLKLEGFRFSEFSLIHEGAYETSDADWNYKDVPHLHFVHELAEAIPTLIADDVITTINTQKVLGFRFPLALVNYASGVNVQTYYTTWFFYILIIETSYESVGTCRTRVKTTYSVGYPPFFAFTFPLIRWILKRNYDNLMSTDIPMRTRRGELRKWGFSFFKDTDSYSFEKTLDIMQSNVIPPQEKNGQKTILNLNLTKELSEDGECFLGHSDHNGLRIVRKGQHLLLFPRMCPHEGANLDRQSCTNDIVICPWHGRVFQPLAVLDLSQKNSQKLDLNGFTLTLNEGTLEYVSNSC